MEEIQWCNYFLLFLVDWNQIFISKIRCQGDRGFILGVGWCLDMGGSKNDRVLSNLSVKYVLILDYILCVLPDILMNHD